MVKKISFGKTQGKRKIKLVFRLFVFGFALVLLFFIFSVGVFIYYAKDLPRPEKFTEKTFNQSTKIYDRTGQALLYELYGEEKREVVALSEISNYMKEAVISAEDANFYKHFGIDLSGIFRAIKLDLALKKPTFGGSTISQQLIRSTFLTNEKSVERKIREIILTLELERRYSKNQILEWHLNQVPFGPNIYGVQSAAKTYFSKPAKDLTAAESALLAATIKAPSFYNPYNAKNNEELFGRKDYVLNRMAQEHYITTEEAEEAKKQELKFAPALSPIKAPHFVFFVQNYLTEKYGQNFLEEGGLKVYTTLDWGIQSDAEKAVLDGVEKNKKYSAYNAALVSIDPKTGEILAMVGSADWFGEPYPKDCVSGKKCLFDPKVNVATFNIGRQPGSSIKPFIYATAFQKGYNDQYVVIDEQTNFGVWGGEEYIPQNYDGKFRGPVTLRQALAQSLNIPSIKALLQLAGIPDSINNARKFGLSTLNHENSFYGPAIVLGGGEVKLLDMVSAYGVFAAEGLKIAPFSVLKIEDSKGNIIEENKNDSKRVIDGKSTIIINSILSDNEARAPMFGINSVLHFPNYQVAVKTGTTNDYRDGWIIGYTPSLVAGVWVGNNNNAAMAKEPGTVLAGPIWRAFLNKTLPRFPKKNFTPLENPAPAENLAPSP
ncbi:MAG: hypothetical protein A3F95_01325 [Candidatus Nealsonbacteria bacterium RIFCSPLOWO2_12_FULL_39_31]|uniref:Uncharacterized protein n=3 Tax=Candidatus Nealsoniibacteriota TaxID=1817911 RepID=A0A1G2EGG9_9BACT|nr:MAG: hypothetical protein A2626_02550 [Candidatus Nealsonbacteria bacterium RIFCSPHIGHO2_01_FULL_38_55]OGZ21236.1 MAG: hypothetical protein A2W55_00565 [Candidatus Nealsonbacteria bacterium RIFCSPHIGHO2_02_38_10]OGZ21386.1 MAG: hypothetical protein A3C48_01390 [Candidatus Nealsonbacteria bacterium RIFCSPHIGHO2_02_FULL_38_75]OGZ22660.1 MAG: hypothetical protein A2981_01520 [Candidatus Nealsonbacteria bacterium RIFCSPLOWO2_01_FULL_38_120]OGZ23618.1 MAG: hypothetical protein A3E18_02290 [Candid